jgi:hypothetical protein
MIHVIAAILLAATAAPAPKNVILLISDGAGLGHFTLAKSIRAENFRTGTLPVIGLFTTNCADRAVTDSAAAATAFATGQKTNYEMLSVDPKTLAPMETVLEAAENGATETRRRSAGRRRASSRPRTSSTLPLPHSRPTRSIAMTRASTCRCFAAVPT